MKTLRAITHEFLPGLKVACRMEGDTFEMEDQRNWSDASFKTYVRPLALPWPYTLAKGTSFTQSVSVNVRASAGFTTGAETRAATTRVALGDGAARAMPELG